MHAILTAGIVLFTSIAIPAGAAEAPATLPASQDHGIVGPYNELAFKAFPLLTREKDDPSPNSVFSPFTLAETFALLHEAAEGETARELRKVLPLPVNADQRLAGLRSLRQFLSDQSPDADLERLRRKDEKSDWRLVRFGTAIWLSPGLRPEPVFRRASDQGFSAAIEPLDTDPTAAAKKINDWVSNQTGGRITKLVVPGQLPPGGAAVTTTSYVKARWDDEFDVERTKPGAFRLGSGKTIEVPMMHATRVMPVHVNDDIQLVVLGLEYGPAYDKGANYSMVVLLPGKGKSLKDLESKWSAERLRNWIAAARPTEKQIDDWLASRPEHLKDQDAMLAEWGRLMEGVSNDAKAKEWWSRSPDKMVTLTLPKFSVKAQWDLLGPTRALGLASLLDPKGSGLKGFGGGLNHVTSMTQAVSFDIHEKGIEAAAAGFVGGLFGGEAGGPPMTFTVDQPFLFVVYDDVSQAILYMGKVQDPSKP